MAREIIFIVARATTGVIAKDGDVPWKIREDLRRFKALSMGKPMVMGRKTFDSLPGLLPGRRHIVLTRQRGWRAEGAEVAHDLATALALAGDEDIAVIGGAEIFALFADIATRFELTEVYEETVGEVVMPHPAQDPSWREIARESRPATGDDPAHDFITYERSFAPAKAAR